MNRRNCILNKEIYHSDEYDDNNVQRRTLTNLRLDYVIYYVSDLFCKNEDQSDDETRAVTTEIKCRQ